ARGRGHRLPHRPPEAALRLLRGRGGLPHREGARRGALDSRRGQRRHLDGGGRAEAPRRGGLCRRDDRTAGAPKSVDLRAARGARGRPRAVQALRRRRARLGLATARALRADPRRAEYEKEALRAETVEDLVRILERELGGRPPETLDLDAEGSLGLEASASARAAADAA